MCLYPKFLINKKYTSTKKNGGIIPPIKDERTKYIPVGCGNCIECRKQKANSWKTRLMEEIKTTKNGIFITLTFSDEAYCQLHKEIKPTEKETEFDIDNRLATLAVRKFLERHRKKYRKPLRHWLITELGHNGTENIHLHGIIFTELPLKEIQDLWGYGYTWPNDTTQTPNYVNERTINYIIKYVTKVDKEHTLFKPKILTSKGIGSNYLNTTNAKTNQYRGEKTKEYYTTRTGTKITLPTYYKNKLYSEEEREQLWLNKLDKETRYVLGNEFDISKTSEIFEQAVEQARKRNQEFGYGTDEITLEEEQYQRQQRRLKQLTRITKAQKKDK